MSRYRSDAAEQVAVLLKTARKSLGVSLAFMTRADDTFLHLQVVDTSLPDLFHEGMALERKSSFCQAIMNGTLPPVISNISDYPEAMKLPTADVPNIRSYVSVPVVLSDGSVYGTFCASGFDSDEPLTTRDKALMEILSQAAAVIVEPGVRERNRNSEIEGRIGPVIDDGGPMVLLQPIVDLASRRRVGAEALSRFPQQWGMAPDECFAEAHTIGKGHRLEVQALRRAADHLDNVSGYVAMNVSPATLLTAVCRELLNGLPLDRIVLELSEHDPVENYDELKEVLAPLRAQGMRLAIDDVGAGYSSLRHIVITEPNVIKLDRSIVTGISDDAVLSVVTRSLVELAHATGAKVVAEGVETAGDAAALQRLSVDHGQGWHFGRAGTVNALRDDYTFVQV